MPIRFLAMVATQCPSYSIDDRWQHAAHVDGHVQMQEGVSAGLQPPPVAGAPHRKCHAPSRPPYEPAPGAAAATPRKLAWSTTASLLHRHGAQRRVIPPGS